MATIGFEEKLWAMADKMRNNMDPSEYKHVVLGLLFLKYISDKFETKYKALVEEGEGFEEDRDEYISENIFWVPKSARWSNIEKSSKTPEIGKIIDDSLIEIEKENTVLRGVLDKRYAKSDIDKTRLGELIDIVSNITLHSKKENEKDLLGRVYEYFLGRFADAEGKGGGEFYTPTSIVQTMVKMIEPYKGRVYDPACGSGGMFVQSEKFVEEHAGKINDISVYGQESNPTTWRLCKMNLAIRGIDGNIGDHHGDTFHNDLHKSLKADFVLANPPFNISDWGGEKLTEDIRWKYGIPPVGNANYAWLQHMVHHLSPNGVAGIVLANGSLSTNTSSEGEIRRKMIEDDLVDCIVAMPTNLFFTTGIPVCLWILNRNKSNSDFRTRKNETLFIDARNMGKMETRKLRILETEDMDKIASIYHEWRKIDGKYEDIKGICKGSDIEEIKSHDYILTPGRYVGIEDVEDDGISFEVKMIELTEKLGEQFKKSKELEEEIKGHLEGLGFKI
jgi:type I restriction enzyme M protein